MANVRIDIEGQPQSILNALTKVIGKINELSEKGERAGQRTRRGADNARGGLDAMGRSFDKVFGPQALAQVGSMIAGYVSIGAAIGTAKRMLDDLNRAREDAAQREQRAESAMGRLALLAGGDPAVYQQLTRAAREAAAKGGGADLGMAANLVFELQSAQALEELPYFTGLYGVDDPNAAAAAAATIRLNLGRERTGRLQDIYSRAVAAAAPSPRVTPSDVLAGAAVPSQAAKQLGVTPDELMAAMSILAGQAGGAEEAGTMLNRLFLSLIKKGVPREGGLPAMLKQVEAKELEDPELIKFFGRELGARAFLGLAGGGLEERMEEVRRAVEEDAAAQMLGVLPTDPGSFSARRARIAGAGRAGTEYTMERGISRNIAEAAIQEQATGMETGGVAAPVIMYRERVNRFLQWFLGDETVIRAIRADRPYRIGGFGDIPGAGSNLPELQEQTAILRDINTKTATVPATGRSPMSDPGQ